MKATVEYDGKNYAGFQWQSQLPSVQGALEDAIRSATGSSRRVRGAGRTDAGAHAVGQVVSFWVETDLSDTTLRRAINAHLPHDVAISRLDPAPDGFDPRRQAVSREYRYVVVNREAPSPLWRGRAFHFRTHVEVEEMQQGANSLVGTHDFSSFATPAKNRRNDEQPRSAVRRLYSVQITRDSDLLVFRLVGTAFMHHMVRTIVGTLLAVGSGRMRADRIAEILAERDHRRAAPPVPSCGLYLMKVNYEANDA